mgnify:CR=1 FL=1|tara:strand:- start:232 stop:666 length:435 start_codon:yes stop_codon:yes gene_type:complete
MFQSFRDFFKNFLLASITLCLSLSLIILPLGSLADAARSSMSGDFAKDTVNVAKSLKETIAVPNDQNNNSDANKDAVVLITDYISRYRNRPQVNQTVSYTTMQTALNAMAGHIKTFSNRPIPEDLKERLNKELSKAEDLVTREY